MCLGCRREQGLPAGAYVPVNPVMVSRWLGYRLGRIAMKIDAQEMAMMCAASAHKDPTSHYDPLRQYGDRFGAIVVIAI